MVQIVRLKPDTTSASPAEAGHYIRHRPPEGGPYDFQTWGPALAGPCQVNSVAATRWANATQGAGYTPTPTTPRAQIAIAAPSRPGMRTGSGRVGASMYIRRATTR